MTDTYKLFEVRNLEKTVSKHARAIDSLNQRMEELDITYNDFMYDAWQAVDTEAEHSLQMIESMGISWTDRSLARIINEKTRDAIAGALDYYEMPRSWDTAFFMAHYMKVIEGMVEILETIKERRK